MNIAPAIFKNSLENLKAVALRGTLVPGSQRGRGVPQSARTKSTQTTYHAFA